MAHITRRAMLIAPALLAGSRLTAQGSASSGPSSGSTPSGKLSSSFPTHDPDLVREVVGVSHGNIARLKELVDRQPALARASWDWGFGDWESALGAASHVGNREIAEYLLSRGARPSIFSATMLGQLDVVKAFVAAQPGVQRTWGPHGITLLSHASAGGAQAKPVLDYLTALGDANEKPALVPLAEEEMKTLSGSYAWGPGADEKFEIGLGKGVLTIIRPGRTQRSLLHLGSYEFYPIGSFAARFRFAEAGGAWVLTLHDPDPVLTARRS
ncbi:MAG TPA: hypothetical protein VFV98_14520 [Vicinamibacterales bacterium]|nr:hypothetical protein [Vicinamibacterales bacterium]